MIEFHYSRMEFTWQNKEVFFFLQKYDFSIGKKVSSNNKSTILNEICSLIETTKWKTMIYVV